MVKHAVRSPHEVQQLADEMITASMVLKSLDSLSEVDTQATILELVGRLQGYIQIKWNRLALDMKKSKGSYPRFDHLVEFINDVAMELNDPVYGNMFPGKSKGK